MKNFSLLLSLSISYGSDYSAASKEITDYENNSLDTIGIITGTPSDYVITSHFNYHYQTIPFRNRLNDNINQFIEIKDGIKENENVIVAPYSLITNILKGGETVTIVPKSKLYEK